MEEIKEQLAYREANKEKVAAFHITRTLGEDTKVLLDEDAGLFMVTASRNLADANPDVLAFSDVTGCKLDIDERKTEIEYRDAEGKRQSFTPCRYAYSYNFYIVINVNNPYFNEIRFQLNDSAVGTMMQRHCWTDRMLFARCAAAPGPVWPAEHLWVAV